MANRNLVFSLIAFLAVTRSFTQACENGTEYECDNGQCISDGLTCDGYWDCPNGEDETDPIACPCDGFTCNDGDCIPSSWICDGYIDCAGEEDEAEPCPPCPGFECPNGDCLPADWECDAYNDCGDWADEAGCPCPPGEVNCGRCIPEAWFCDTVSDCPDGSDESDCMNGTAITNEAHNQLVNAHYISLLHRQHQTVRKQRWTVEQRAFKKAIEQEERREFKRMRL